MVSDIETPPLDPEQAAAARSDPRRPLLVLAGPGSGKTAMLVERIALLLDRQPGGPRPAEPIVALTFTRNAARELASRLRRRLGDDPADRVDVRTFHSLGLRLLREGWAGVYLGRSQVRIATRGQTAQAAAAALADVGLDVPDDEVVRVIADAKLSLPPRPAPLDAARRAYDARLSQRGLIDLQDLLLLPVAILRTQPTARADLQRRVGHVVSDEGQDWNGYQAALVAYAGGRHGHITAVGDPMQSIFGHSSPRYLVEFPAAFSQAHVSSLTRSYRLDAAVLAVANVIAAHIAGATALRVPARGAGPRPLLHIARSPAEEIAWIAGELQALRAAHVLCGWHEAVVLVRTRRQRWRLAQGLAAASIPCRAQPASVAGTALSETLMAWLALLRDGADGAAVLRAVAALPSHGHGTTAGSLCAALQASGPWTMARLRRECPPGLSDAQKRELGAFVRLYDGLAALAARREPTVILDAVLERAGLQERLAQAGPGAHAEVAALRALAAEEGDVGALEHLLAEDAPPDSRDVVRVSTVHAFKGQEADVVFVAGLDEGLFPHRRCLHDGAEGLQQELRAFYVALTRPRSRLYLSAACEPVTPQAQGQPSRFLQLIPTDLLQRV